MRETNATLVNRPCSKGIWAAVGLLTCALTAGCDQDPVAAPSVAKTFRAPEKEDHFDQLGDSNRAKHTIELLRPLHEELGPPRPGEWLDSHEETGQTYDEYLAIRPSTPTAPRTVIYIQPLGEFTKEQREIVEFSAEYLGIYMNRPAKILDDLPLSIIPASARRQHPQWGMDQILTTHVLYEVLRPRRPDDAAAYIAFTATDLWPGKGWNFVFGQASLRDRVGVWSIHRNGDPASGDDEFRTCLRRTLKTATHETGHMFSLKHCTAFECNMCGSNHRQESDRHPLYLCPECHAKILWATGADPAKRFQKLADFCERHKLSDELTYFQSAIKKMGSKATDRSE